MAVGGGSANYQGLLSLTVLLCLNLYLLHSVQTGMDVTLSNIRHNNNNHQASSLSSWLYDSFAQNQRSVISYIDFHNNNNNNNDDQKDATNMKSKYNEKLALKFSRIDYATIEQNPLREASCLVDQGKVLLMHDTHVLRWVCQQHSEHKVTAIMRHVFENACSVEEFVADEEGWDTKQYRASRALVVDVGSNSGFYGLYAIAMGCETLFFDLQKQCHNMIQNELIVNGFLKHGRVFGYGISDHATTMEVPDDSGCDGRFPVSKYEVEERMALRQFGEDPDAFFNGQSMSAFDTSFQSSSTTKSVVELHTLDHFVDPTQPIVMIKIDTEGHEHSVLSGSMHFFQKRLIRNAVVEITPGHRFWEWANVTPEQVAAAFQQIASFGYTMISLWDWTRHETPDAVFQYIVNASFVQSDMWLTLEDISDMTLSEIHQSIPDPPTPPPHAEEPYTADDDFDRGEGKEEEEEEVLKNDDGNDADREGDDRNQEGKLLLEEDAEQETEQVR
jgi:FkbM family methyltransferase